MKPGSPSTSCRCSAYLCARKRAPNTAQASKHPCVLRGNLLAQNVSCRRHPHTKHLSAFTAASGIHNAYVAKGCRTRIRRLPSHLPRPERHGRRTPGAQYRVQRVDSVQVLLSPHNRLAFLRRDNNVFALRVSASHTQKKRDGIVSCTMR